MSNSKKTASIAFTGAVAAAATMMGITPTLAASAFVIKAGGRKIVPPATFRARIMPGTNAILKDSNKNTTLTCKKATTSGTFSKASGVTPAKIGVINNATWSSCTGPFGLTFRASLNTQTVKPNLVISKLKSTFGSIIGASGYLSGTINDTITGTGLAGACRATISLQAGKHIHVVYNDAFHSHLLNIDPGHSTTLRVKSVANCFGALNVGDKAYFAATYVVSSPALLTIS